MDLRKALYQAQLSNPEGREECVVQYEGGRCRMTRAEMASARGVEFQYERTLPSGRQLFKAVQPSNSGRSMKKSAGLGLDAPATFGDAILGMYHVAASKTTYSEHREF